MYVDLEGVEFTKWGGVKMRGSGFINKIFGFFVNNSQFINRMIRKKTEDWVNKMLPAKLREFTDRIYEKVDNLVHKLMEKYSTRIVAEN